MRKTLLFCLAIVVIVLVMVSANLYDEYASYQDRGYSLDVYDFKIVLERTIADDEQGNVTVEIWPILPMREPFPVHRQVGTKLKKGP